MDVTTTMARQPWSKNHVIMTLISHKKNGDVIYKITFKMWAIAFAVGMALLLFFSVGEDAITSWAKQKDADVLRPKMEALADEGKDYASMWLVQHYYDANTQRLNALVAKGIPDAMFIQGAIKVRDGDKDGGMRLIEQAAAQGYERAMHYIESRKS